MATNLFSRSLPKTLTLASFLSRSFSSSAAGAAAAHSRSSSLSLLRRLRPLVGAAVSLGISPSTSLRCLSTNVTSSSLKDPNPNWSNRPPKETILLDGCDFEHWLVVMEPPEGEPTRDDIIDSYIKTLAMVVGSEQEARMKIYSVSTRCYFAFGALVSEELSYKIKELPRVRWVLPDSYLDVKNKDYGGEPFINGEAVPYDPKYHEEWIRNNARANERNRRNDRPRNFDRSKNFERRRENMQSHDGPRGPPPPPGGNNMGPPPPRSNMGPPPPPPPGGNMGPPPPHMQHQQHPQNSMGPPPPHNAGPGYHPQHNNYNHGMPPQQNNWGPPPNNNYRGPPPPPPPNNYNPGGMQQNNNPGWSGQNNYSPNRDM